MNATRPNTTSTAEDPKLPGTKAVHEEVAVAVGTSIPLKGLNEAAVRALTRGTGKFIGGSLSVNVLNEKQVELVQIALHGNAISHGVFTL